MLVIDRHGNTITVGVRTQDMAGTVTRLDEPDGDHHARVTVAYDDGGEATWETQPDGPGYAWYECDDVAVRV